MALWLAPSILLLKPSVSPPLQNDLGFEVVSNSKGRRLQSLVWDMDKNATDDFQCVFPKEMKYDACVQPLPLVVKHFQQVPNPNPS